MIPVHLRLSGFLSYRDPVEIDFTTFELACISGHNGAGKSSLLDAITWALFGQARKRDDSLVNTHPGVKAAEVAFTFSYEGETYRVIRLLPRGKTTQLEFQIRQSAVSDQQSAVSDQQSAVSGQQSEWRPLTERTTRETQARIESALRLDYETFVNASFVLQGKADQFTQQSPGKRKDILGTILGLEAWDVYKERAAERRKALEGDLASVDGRVAEIETELAEEPERRQRLSGLEAELARLVEVRKTQEAALRSLRKAAASKVAAEKGRLEEERRSLKEQEKTVRQQAGTLPDLTARLEQARRSLEEAEQHLARRADFESERTAARESHAELKAENEWLKAAMDDLKGRVDRLQESRDAARCPLCGQPLSEAHLESTVGQLNAEGKEKGDRFRANKARLEELAGQIREHDAQAAAFGNADRARLAASTAVAQLDERLETARKAAQEWEAGGAKRLEEVEATLAGEAYTRQVEAPAGDVEQAERTLLSLQEQENNLNQEVGAARQKVAVLDDLRKRREKLDVDRAGLALSIGRHKTLERAFGRDGVPALLIEQALPEIESKANELLDRLSDGGMSVRFVTQAGYKDRKREDLRETLDIQISDGAGERDYELFSGGEAFRVNFAIRLALSKVLAGRKGARLQTLVIDEGFGSQDAQGRQRLIEAINAVRSDFARILVITHMDELKDAFPTRIEVEKVGGSSVVKVL